MYNSQEVLSQGGTLISRFQCTLHNIVKLRPLIIFIINCASCYFLFRVNIMNHVRLYLMVNVPYMICNVQTGIKNQLHSEQEIIPLIECYSMYCICIEADRHSNVQLFCIPTGSPDGACDQVIPQSGCCRLPGIWESTQWNLCR